MKNMTTNKPFNYKFCLTALLLLASPFMAPQYAGGQAASGCSIDWGSTKKDGFDSGVWAKYEKAACDLGKQIKAVSCHRTKAEQQKLRSECEAKGDAQKCNGLVATAGRSFHQGKEHESNPEAVACDFEKSGITSQEAEQKFADIGKVGTRCYGQPHVVHIDNHGPYTDQNACGGGRN